MSTRTGDERTEALYVRCPKCRRKPGQWCVTAGGNTTSELHARRYQEADEARRATETP